MMPDQERKLRKEINKEAADHVRRNRVCEGVNEIDFISGANFMLNYTMALMAALKQIEEQCVWVDHCKCEPTDPCKIANAALAEVWLQDKNLKGVLND